MIPRMQLSSRCVIVLFGLLERFSIPDFHCCVRLLLLSAVYQRYTNMVSSGPIPIISSGNRLSIFGADIHLQ